MARYWSCFGRARLEGLREGAPEGDPLPERWATESVDRQQRDTGADSGTRDDL
ncbi:hypothetical protein QJS10_CPA16g00596 [Acorus calamus]|uniref:Uncharacterized protein n=1 Tax=Acorus calamus TaxID=4465 RepID=A0AAV9D0S3_ACOCL|nr:hypothetical protein QJS10_CPA16g00596 [Acorus calamus]